MTTLNYGAIRSAEKFEAFADRIIAAGKPFGFDIESGYSGPARASSSLQTAYPQWFLVGFSFTNSLQWARYVPVAHDDGDNVDDVVRTARALWRMLQTGLAVAHNIPFELKGTSRWFREVLGKEDSEIGEQVRASNGLFPFRSDTIVETFLAGEYHPLTVGQDLKSLVMAAFGHKMIKFDELFEGKVSPRTARFNSLPVSSKVVTYACEDSLWCLALHEKHHPDLKDQFVYKTEMALVPVLVGMEQEGMFLDWAEIARKDAEVVQLIEKMNEEIQQELSRRLGETVNINLGSPKQLGEVLFEKLGLPVKVRSEKTNEPSTSEKALRQPAKEDGTVARILEYREAVKLHGSYLKKYMTELNYAGNGRAYPNHKQTGASSGRMSVDGVSYQQWPKPYEYSLDDGTHFYLNFRNLLISPPGFRIIGFDYSQVELRILAGQANETAMLHAFATGVDIHKATASTMMGIPLEEVTKKERSDGKTLNFAVVYGSGAKNIADMLTTPERLVTTEDAEDMLAQYYAAFSKLRKYMDAKVVEGKQQGYIHNLFGRKVRIWELDSTNPFIRSKGERLCVNAPIQGGAADYAKIAMVRADRAIKKAGLQGKIRMVMMIHDALEFYVHDDVDTQTVLDILRPAVSFEVPGLPEIRSDWHECKRWGETVELALDENGKIEHYEIEDVPEPFATIEEAYERWAQITHDKEHKVVAPKPVQESAPEVDHGDATVTIREMPDWNQWELFRAFLLQAKGDRSVTLITPEGATTFSGVRLTPDDQPKVSALLGGALLTFTTGEEWAELGRFAHELQEENA